MITVLQYLVIAAAIGLVVFFLAVLVFGRGEQMAPLPARTSPAELPGGAVSGDNIRAVRFAVGVRGYRMGDVDWTLDRMADEIDRLRAEIRTLGGDPDRIPAEHEGELLAVVPGHHRAPGDAGVPASSVTLAEQATADPANQPAQGADAEPTAATWTRSMDGKDDEPTAATWTRSVGGEDDEPTTATWTRSVGGEDDEPTAAMWTRSMSGTDDEPTATTPGQSMGGNPGDPTEQGGTGPADDSTERGPGEARER